MNIWLKVLIIGLSHTLLNRTKNLLHFVFQIIAFNKVYLLILIQLFAR